jgi:hypothetical protein
VLGLTVVLPAVTAGVFGAYGLGVGDADDSVAPKPVDAALASVLTQAASSCPALTPARLAGQIMAATRFEPDPAGGIGGLTAAEWEKWAPRRSSTPGDPAASTLALAHLTCDLVGQVRAAGVDGDLWRTAVAVWRSSVSQVKAANGVPTAAAGFVDQAQEYAHRYALTPALLRSPDPTTGAPSPTATTPTASPSPTPRPARSTATPEKPRLVDRRVTWNMRTFAPGGLHLNGAVVADGRLRLARGDGAAGSAWARIPLRTGRSWATEFTVDIPRITDGLALVVQGQGPTALGSDGSGIGYGRRPATADPRIDRSVAVELDLWSNSLDGFDPGHQHVAVTKNGDVAGHLVERDPGFALHGGGPYQVWATYDAPTRTLRVWAARSSARPAAPLLTATVDIAATVGRSTAYIGFTAGTGHIVDANPEIAVTSWAFAER